MRFIFFCSLVSRYNRFLLNATEYKLWLNLLIFIGSASFVELRKILLKAHKRSNKKMTKTTSLEKFRKLLSKDYPKSFPFQRGGDADSFLQFLHNNFTELQSKFKLLFKYKLNVEITLQQESFLTLFFRNEIR